MNHNDTAVVTSTKLTPDAMAKLREWASANLTSMSAEIIRSVRERAERETEKA